jgi:hypothetical protein
MEDNRRNVRHSTLVAAQRLTFSGSFFSTPLPKFLLGTAIVHDYLRRGILIAEYHHNVYPDALFVNPQTRIFSLFSYVSLPVPCRALDALISAQRLRVYRNGSRWPALSRLRNNATCGNSSGRGCPTDRLPLWRCAVPVYVVQPEAANPDQSTIRENTYEFCRPRRDFPAGQRPRKGH